MALISLPLAPHNLLECSDRGNLAIACKENRKNGTDTTQENEKNLGVVNKETALLLFWSAPVPVGVRVENASKTHWRYKIIALKVYHLFL